MVNRSRRPAPARLAEKLRAIRCDRLFITQATLVRRLKYTSSPLYPSQISNFEQGKREPPAMLLLAYARLAGISLESLIDDALDLPVFGPHLTAGKDISD